MRNAPTRGPAVPEVPAKCHSWSGSAADSLEDGSACGAARTPTANSCRACEDAVPGRYLVLVFNYERHVRLDCGGLLRVFAGSAGRIRSSLISNLEMKVDAVKTLTKSACVKRIHSKKPSRLYCDNSESLFFLLSHKCRHIEWSQWHGGLIQIPGAINRLPRE